MPRKDIKTVRMEGESQSQLVFHCAKTGNVHQVLNKRTYTLWVKLHKKKCDCLKDGFHPQVNPRTPDLYTKTGQIRSRPDDLLKSFE